MSKLYLECASGISGDMLVAALIDLGVDQDMLMKALDSIPVDGYEVVISRAKKSALDVCDFDVRLDAVHENHDHDMSYLHGVKKYDHDGHNHNHHEHGECSDDHHEHSEHSHDHGHSEHSDNHHGHSKHSHDHHDHSGHAHDHPGHDGHSHDHHSHEAAHDYSHPGYEAHAHHNHQHGEHDHAHHHRGMKEITAIINQTAITAGAKQLALRIFEILAQAEAKAHGTTIQEVHFHEVGAVDSIVDIIAAAVCLDSLAVDEVIIPVLYEGMGTVRCQHGILPIPVPAVANITAAHNIKLHITSCQGELVTPTGAAIAAAVRTSETLPAQFRVLGVGLGGGKRTYECPGFLRAMLIEETVKTDETKDFVYVIETNIDDCTGEALGYAMDQLLEHGAKDVSYQPIFMKKNRPAYLLTVICDEAHLSVMEAIIFRETTAIGVRKTRMERTILKRELKTMKTSLGEVQVKLCVLPGAADVLRIYPEHDSIAALCRRHGKSYQDICQLVMRECHEQL